MSQIVKRERFPLLRTSLLKMHNFPLFPGGATKLLARNFSNFWKNQKAEELLNMIFENSSPKWYFLVK